MDHLSSRVDPERHRVLAGKSRVRVLEALRAEGAPLSVTDIAARVDLHPNTVRLHLGQLVEAGLAVGVREDRDRPGRPRVVYTALTGATETSTADLAGEQGRYTVLAEVLVHHLERTAWEPTIEATAAGRAWGRAMIGQGSVAPSVEQATADLTELLDQLGFVPRPGESGQTVELHRCPFRQAAEEHSPVVCGVHLGLMQGALAQSRAPLRVSGLEPFVTPQLCLARLDTENPRTTAPPLHHKPLTPLSDQKERTP